MHTVAVPLPAMCASQPHSHPAMHLATAHATSPHPSKTHTFHRRAPRSCTYHAAAPLVDACFILLCTSQLHMSCCHPPYTCTAMLPSPSQPQALCCCTHGPCCPPHSLTHHIATHMGHIAPLTATHAALPTPCSCMGHVAPSHPHLPHCCTHGPRCPPHSYTPCITIHLAAAQARSAPPSQLHMPCHLAIPITATYTAHLATSTHAVSSCATHATSPCAMHTASPCAMHTTSPCAMHTTLPYAVHTMLPCAAHTASLCATHTALPCAMHTASPFAVHAALLCATYTMSLCALQHLDMDPLGMVYTLYTTLYLFIIAGIYLLNPINCNASKHYKHFRINYKMSGKCLNIAR